MNEIGFPTQTVGADSIRLNVAGVSHSANGSSMKSAPLGFPRGEAVAFSGSSEPMKVTDEGQRYVKVSVFPDEW